jgi:hypothetical protein
MHSWQTFLRDGRAVFRRHWKLLVLPIPLALLITVWVVVSTPTMYQSQAAVWSNITSAQAAANAQAANGATPLTPAAEQQSLLNELLATDSFRTSVAAASPLSAWLQANPPAKLTPSGLTGLLHGTPALSARIRTALLSGTSTTLNGPQVMTISFQAQSPSLAHDTLAAMLNTFAAQRSQLVAQSEGTFRVLDEPSVPVGPTTGVSKSLATVLYGLIAGIIVSLLAVIILTLLARRSRSGAPAGVPSGNGVGPATPGPAASVARAMPPEPALRANGDARTTRTPSPRS